MSGGLHGSAAALSAAGGAANRPSVGTGRRGALLLPLGCELSIDAREEAGADAIQSSTDAAIGSRVATSRGDSSSSTAQRRLRRFVCGRVCGLQHAVHTDLLELDAKQNKPDGRISRHSSRHLSRLVHEMARTRLSRSWHSTSTDGTFAFVAEHQHGRHARAPRRSLAASRLRASGSASAGLTTARLLGLVVDSVTNSLLDPARV
jgi:hypothetical protein